MRSLCRAQNRGAARVPVHAVRYGKYVERQIIEKLTKKNVLGSPAGERGNFAVLAAVEYSRGKKFSISRFCEFYEFINPEHEAGRIGVKHFFMRIKKMRGKKNCTSIDQLIATEPPSTSTIAKIRLNRTSPKATPWVDKVTHIIERQKKNTCRMLASVKIKKKCEEYNWELYKRR